MVVMRVSAAHATVWFCAAFLAAAAVGASPSVHLPDSHRSLLATHCLKCHGAEDAEGNVRLDDLAFEITSVETAERWQKVLNVLNSGAMPPEDEPPLAAPAKADLVDDLAQTMVAARKSLADQRGTITMRRLNRREYRNTLRDLLGAEINVAELPADTGNGSFDTVGSNLFMSSNQFEQYQALGREAIEEALARHSARSVVQRHRYEAEQAVRKLVKVINEEIEQRDRARRWVAAVDAAAARPENAAVVAEIRKQVKNDAEFRRSWERISGAPSPVDYGFGEPFIAVVGNAVDKANASLNPYFLPYHQDALTPPGIDTGAYLANQTVHPAILDNGYVSTVVPHHWQPGDFIVRFRVAGNEQATPERRFIEFGIHPRFGQVLSTHEVTGTLEHPQVIEVPITLTRKHTDTGDRTLFVREKNSIDSNELASRRYNESKKKNGIGPEYAIWVDWLEIERVPAKAAVPPGVAILDGMLDDKKPPSRSQIEAAIEAFSHAAFRGTLPPASFVGKLLAIYDHRLAAGDKHSAALKETLSVVLAAPMFLYLAEPAVDGQPRPLTQHELAGRLSYFLWGAPPDQELRDLATKGELAQPAVLAAQAERLLDDPRSQGFLEPFVYQWLGLHRLDFFEVDRTKFPDFDNSTRLAAKHEIYETVGHLLRTNGSLRDLLAADYVVVNNVLARHYGLDGVAGDQFRPVPLPAGSPRGGFLGMTAFHLMGGNGNETSPVERGAWVLRKMLDDPPPPAPANVPAIARLAGKAVTPAERLRMHQEEPQCASCHRRIDPIGLGLENFDAIGRWRMTDSYKAEGSKDVKTWTIEPAGALFGGPTFADFYELRSIIAERPDAFARGFSRALVEYSLGRPCGFSDEQLLDAMVAQGKTKNFLVRELIQALVASDAFHTK
jgi:mono/diheme cytochrome c family protein